MKGYYTAAISVRAIHAKPLPFGVREGVHLSQAKGFGLAILGAGSLSETE